MTIAIVDSGFIFSLLDTDDEYHKTVLSIVRDKQWQLHVPHLTLVEVFHINVERHLSAIRSREWVVRNFAEGLLWVTERLGFQFEEMTTSDYRRVAQLLDTYADSNIDYVDAVVFAMAERFGTPYIMTVDERDFRRYKPAFAEHFVLPVFDS